MTDEEKLYEKAKKIVKESIDHAYPFITEIELIRVVLRLLKEIEK